MNLHDRLKTAVRDWLGLNVLAGWVLEQKIRSEQRHEAQMDVLNRIEQRLINEHIGQTRPQFVPATLDWDTVQAIALQDLERNPEKEH